MAMTNPNPHPSPAPRSIEIELLALDLSTCTRCTGSLANVERAIEAVRAAAEPTGTEILLRKIVIDSEAAARRHRFTSSPTIRVAGRDLAFETLESRCDSCSELCGCDEGTSCRVWRYRGEDHDEAPIGLIVEALLHEIAAAPASGTHDDEPPIEVPENLRRFFAGRTKRAGGEATTCCPPEELESCCPPAEKASCCAPAATACGCA
jgi:hypothetical protein